MHLQTIGTRSMRPVQTANTALPFTPARSPLHCDARGFVHPTVALTHCNWYHPVERVREHAHLSPSRRLRHAITPTVECPCHPAFAGTSVPSCRVAPSTRHACHPSRVLPTPATLLAHECAHAHSLHAVSAHPPCQQCLTHLRAITVITPIIILF